MPNSTDILIGNRIRIARKLTGFTQGELAENFGITYQQMQKYETGMNCMRASMLAKIAELTKKPISYFFEQENIEPLPDNFSLRIVIALKNIKNSSQKRRFLALLEAMAEKDK